MKPRWFWWSSALLGIALLAFIVWLYAGLMEIVRRSESAMFVARPGPGLLVVGAGAAVILAGAIAEHVCMEQIA